MENEHLNEMQKSVMGFSSWELLPYHIWENILSCLPILTLVRMKIVCKTWRSIINSQSFLAVYKKANHQDIYFVLFADFIHRNIAAAYNPMEDKWFAISLSHISSSSPSTSCKIRRTLVSDGSLVLAEDSKGSFFVSNLFTRTFQRLPPMLPLIWSYTIALVELDFSYKIVAVSVTDKVYSQVYDSITKTWEAKGEFDGRFAMLGNATHLDGFLYCLSYSPDNLLEFDLNCGTWSVVNVMMPSVVCSHILVHRGVLILVGGIEEFGVIKRIGIWELDRVVRQWLPVCFMPDHLFYKFRLFSHGNLNQFFTVDRGGKLCFCKSTLPHINILMYDLSEKRWWWLPPCPLGSSLCKQSWFGHAVEPRMDVLV
eukprot:TRINITY_DN7082_c0_g1_i1.p1 TRINITY_DN7082_c0_g1~~TRINITY_DN7082_c0_g1_i1.p1  ORF type:complete len:369 (+),score=57.11 TRINITY_DN7082_c0_g1_i1:635-1741(+)